MTGYLVPSLGSLDILWGTKSLKEIKESLHFTINKLNFKSKSNCNQRCIFVAFGVVAEWSKVLTAVP